MIGRGTALLAVVLLALAGGLRPDQDPAGSAGYQSVQTAADDSNPPPPADAKLIAPYRWAESGRDPLAEAAAFTLVKGIGPRHALHILDPHPATPVWGPGHVDRWVEHHPYHNGYYYQGIYAGHRDGWTFILEDNGYLATEHVARLSRHGAAVVIYNDVEDLASFQYGRAGRKVRDFDPFLYPPAERKHRLPQEHGIQFGNIDGRYLARSMLLAHRLTHLHLTLADVQRSRYYVAVATRY